MRPVQDKKYQHLLYGAAQKANAMHSGRSYVFCQKNVPPGCSFLQMRYKAVSHFPGVSALFTPSDCSGQRSFKSFKTNHLVGYDSLTLLGKVLSAFHHSVNSAGLQRLEAQVFFAAINNLMLPVLVSTCHLLSMCSRFRFVTCTVPRRKRSRKDFFSFPTYIFNRNIQRQQATQVELFSFFSVAAMVPAEKLMWQYVLCWKLYTAHQNPLKISRFFSQDAVCLPTLIEVNRNYILQDLLLGFTVSVADPCARCCMTQNKSKWRKIR